MIVLSTSCEVQRFEQVLRCPFQQLVEDVKVSLPRLLFHDPGLLQEVILNVAPSGIPLEIKIDVHVFAEATGVVIPVCLGVAERLHDLIGPDQDSCHSGLTRIDIQKTREREEKTQHQNFND